MSTTHIGNVDSVYTSQERVQKSEEIKQVPLTDEQLLNVLHKDGCERIENFYVVGPVQKAAVWSFARAIESAHGIKEPKL